MSEFPSGSERVPDRQVREEAESQTAASAQTASPASSSNPVANLDYRKLLPLLKNPSAGRRLDPQADWIYGAIGAAAGAIGFFFWVWSLKEALEREANDFLGVLGGGLPFMPAFEFGSAGKFLLLGICSLILLVGSLAAIGNRVGGRKRSWRESAVYQGATQLIFGAGWLAAGIVAFVSIELSCVIGIFALLLSLISLVSQAADLHEVGSDRRFAFHWQSLAAYVVLLYLAYSLLG